MDIYIVNEVPAGEGGYDAAGLDRLVEALQAQLIQDWAPAHERQPPLLHIAATEAEVDPASPLMVGLLHADQAGVLGYHTLTPKGRIYSPVFWAPVRDNGGDLWTGATGYSSVWSHETLELASNPLVCLMCDRSDGQSEEPAEVCDRVEGDSYETKDHPGVGLSNFLYPRAFADGTQGPPYDHMRLLQSRDGMTPGGYVSIRTGGPAGPYTQVFGDKMPAYRRAQICNPHPASRSARRRA